MKFSRFLAAASLATLMLPAAVLAQGKAVVTTERVRAELMAHAPQGAEPGKTVWVGLQLKHQPHWHTYWLNPGDSGLPGATPSGAWASSSARTRSVVTTAPGPLDSWARADSDAASSRRRANERRTKDMCRVERCGRGEFTRSPAPRGGWWPISSRSW